MRNPIGQCGPLKDSSEGTPVDALQVSKVNTFMLPSQVELINFIMIHGIEELIKSLKLVHSLALYHTNLAIEGEEKSALFDVKMLWEGLEQVKKET